VQCQLGSQSRRGGTSGRQQSWVRQGEYAGFHRGLRAGHGVTGETRELGRATGLLGREGRKSRGTGGPRALAVTESFRWSPSPAGNTNHGSSQGIGERATSEATQEGPEAVVAEHSTAEGGEVRPKRPTGGKARPGRACAWEDRREGLRAYQPSQQIPGHRRRVAQLCARGPGQPTGYPDRSSGPDTDEPDELIAHVRDCGGAGRVTAGSTRHLTAALLRFCLKKGYSRAAAGER
jgi:hypothetical protein